MDVLAVLVVGGLAVGLADFGGEGGLVGLLWVMIWGVGVFCEWDLVAFAVFGGVGVVGLTSLLILLVMLLICLIRGSGLE